MIPRVDAVKEQQFPAQDFSGQLPEEDAGPIQCRFMAAGERGGETLSPPRKGSGLAFLPRDPAAASSPPNGKRGIVAPVSQIAPPKFSSIQRAFFKFLDAFARQVKETSSRRSRLRTRQRSTGASSVRESRPVPAPPHL